MQLGVVFLQRRTPLRVVVVQVRFERPAEAIASIWRPVHGFK
jgi:hypothetical protein